MVEKDQAGPSAPFRDRCRHRGGFKAIPAGKNAVANLTSSSRRRRRCRRCMGATFVRIHRLEGELMARNRQHIEEIVTIRDNHGSRPVVAVRSNCYIVERRWRGEHRDRRFRVFQGADHPLPPGSAWRGSRALGSDFLRIGNTLCTMAPTPPKIVAPRRGQRHLAGRHATLIGPNGCAAEPPWTSTSRARDHDPAGREDEPRLGRGSGDHGTTRRTDAAAPTS